MMENPMDQQTSSYSGHSSNVTMSLLIGDATFSVLQSSENAIKLKDANAVPPGDAILEITVDGRPHRRLIRVHSSQPRPNWLSITGR
jgi:hypothetical protein